MRLIARYAKDRGDFFEIITLYDKDIDIEKISKENPTIKTISYTHPTAIWFERKIQDDFGIDFVDAFDKRPLVHQEQFDNTLHPMCKEFNLNELDFSPFEPYQYETIKGDGVFQVSVGPIHAGIIEPGHFHFSQVGEKMLHLEVRHFYKYRAIEKMLEGKTLLEAKPIIERISGNESIAYQICLRDIMLKASDNILPLSLQKQHALLLELERVIHHFTDLGFIPNDAGFGSALAIGSKSAEDARRAMRKITGHRFGFGSVNFNKSYIDTVEFRDFLDKLEEDILSFESWITDIPSVWDRLDTTGILSREKALKYDMVGVVARASGVKIDRRLKQQLYIDAGFKITLGSRGDVASRFKVRIEEIKNSISLMRYFLEENSKREIIENIEKSQDGSYQSFCESSIGELFMAIDIKNGLIDRCYIRDASFINWQGVHLMMLNDIIADFPLINKSCDLSYAGSDL